MRPFLALLLAACLGTVPALAQEQDLTTDAQGAASAHLTIDPRAHPDATPPAVAMLTGLYATLATVDVCGIAVAAPVDAAMLAHRQQLETGLAMDAATGEKAYAAVHDDVEKAGLDCAEGSSDRQQTDAVIALYAQEAPPQ